MLQSLSSRLLLAFAAIILISLAVSGVGALLLLRDQQRESAEERVGRLAEPITLAVALLEQANVDDAEIQDAIEDYAASFDVRVLLVSESGYVVGDTESRLTGRTVDVFRQPDIEVTNRGGAEFRMAKYDAEDEDNLLLFAPPRETLQISSNRLVQLQALIYELYASGVPPEELQVLLTDLSAQAEGPQTLPLPELRPLVAVTESQVTSAWLDLIPRLAIAGGIALAASVVVAALISRSITGRLARVTRAAQEMSRGNYEQQLDARGQDEVAHLGQAFNVMAREVSHSHRMMRDLLANVSHELKTPLTSIQGFSQAMEEGAITSKEQFEQAGKIINEETQRMRSLVDDLIELSRLESGQAIVRNERVDVESLLRTCAGRFDWQLRDSGAKLDLDLESLPPVYGDERRLEQAFTNLIDNAVRHAPTDGAITVSAQSRNGAARIAVHNTGSFIPPEDLPRIFERFYQQERHRSRNAGGSAGLGLAIAREVVQAHKGKIEATSDRDSGTEFVITLPVGKS